MIVARKFAAQGSPRIVCAPCSQAVAQPLPASFAPRVIQPRSIARGFKPTNFCIAGVLRQMTSAARADAGNRDFDVVVWGATGFVGQLVCQRLASQYTDVRFVHCLSALISDGTSKLNLTHAY